MRYLLICLILLAIPAAAQTPTLNYTVNIIGAITFSPTSMTFKQITVGNSGSQNFTIKNNGSSTLSYSVSFGGTYASDYGASDGCSGSIAANATCTIGVTFTPTTTNNETATIKVAVSGGNTYSANLSTSLATPILTLTPTSTTISDSAPIGTIVSQATVTMSDGSPFTGTLQSSDTTFFSISGLNIILQHNLSSSDDGAHITSITATQP